MIKKEALRPCRRDLHLSVADHGRCFIYIIWCFNISAAEKAEESAEEPEKTTENAPKPAAAAQLQRRKTGNQKQARRKTAEGTNLCTDMSRYTMTGWRDATVGRSIDGVADPLDDGRVGPDFWGHAMFMNDRRKSQFVDDDSCATSDYAGPNADAFSSKNREDLMIMAASSSANSVFNSNNPKGEAFTQANWNVNLNPGQICQKDIVLQT